MITYEDFLPRLRQRPFQPFAVHLHDGRVFEIRYPEMNLVGTTWIDIGVPEPNPSNKEDPFAEYAEIVDYDKIARIEPLDVPSPPVSA